MLSSFEEVSSSYVLEMANVDQVTLLAYPLRQRVSQSDSISRLVRGVKLERTE